MIRINRNVGARVKVNKVLVEISPEVGWRYLKNIEGVIVENTGFERYWHTCSGGRTHITKHIIEHDFGKTYAVKLNNDIVDIEGNNIIVFDENNLKFLDRIEVQRKPVSYKNYLNALKIVERYKSENKIV